MPTRQPDLSLFVCSHRALRRDAGELAAALTRRRVDRARLGAALDCLAEMLAAHQTFDEQLASILRPRRAGLDAELDALSAEHRDLDGLVGRLRRALDGAHLPVEPAALAANLAAQLSSHLAREEERIVPAIFASLTLDEWHALWKAQLEAGRGSAFVAWALSVADDGERERVLATLPPGVEAAAGIEPA